MTGPHSDSTKGYPCLKCGNTYYVPSYSSVGVCSFCAGAMISLSANLAATRDADLDALVESSVNFAIVRDDLVRLCKQARDERDTAQRYHSSEYKDRIAAEALASNLKLQADGSVEASIRAAMAESELHGLKIRYAECVAEARDMSQKIDLYDRIGHRSDDLALKTAVTLISKECDRVSDLTDLLVEVQDTLINEDSIGWSSLIERIQRAL